MDVFQIDSRDFLPRQRVLAFRDAAAQMCKLDITPDADQPFESTLRLHLLPALQISNTTWTTATTVRTARHAYDTGDNVLIHIPLTGQFRMRQQGGREVICRPGSVYIDPTSVGGVDVFEAPRTDLMYVSIPRERLAASGGLDARLRKCLPLDAHWRLFQSYARSITLEAKHLAPEALAMCSQHLCDLAVLALGARSDARDEAAGRGLRAARLWAVKQQIDAQLTDPELSPDAVAARCGISTRYLRALFADEQTTFRNHVASQRLALARLRLQDGPFRRMTISEIALSVGFGDLSWFNHIFRARFGMTPSEARATACAAGPWPESESDNASRSE